MEPLSRNLITGFSNSTAKCKVVIMMHYFGTTYSSSNSLMKKLSLFFLNTIYTLMIYPSHTFQSLQLFVKNVLGCFW